MAASPDRLDVVRALIQSAPDPIVRQLDAALRDVSAEDGLSAIRDLIDIEVSDRRAMRLVFAPIMPLFEGRADGFEQVRLPAAAIPLLWQALKRAAPQWVLAARSHQGVDPDRGQIYPPSFDKLCLEAAAGLRGDDPAFASVRALLNGAPGGTLELAAFLDLTPLARQSLDRLPGWIRRVDEVEAAAVRLLFRDAVAIAEDAAPRLVEIFLGHLKEPWTVVRFISVATRRGGEGYVSSSELAGFGERIMAYIDTQLALVRRFDLRRGGVDAATTAAAAVTRAVAAATEFENNLELNRSGVWGQRTARQKADLANLVEGYLRKCVNLTADALPIELARHGGPGLPPLDMSAVDRAMTALTFFDGVRLAASSGGYASARTRIGQEIGEGLNTYLRALLSILRDDDPVQVETARAYLAALADFTALLDGESAAQTVRRRAATL